MANRVYETGVCGTFGIAFDNLSLLGITAQWPFQVALIISAEEMGELRISLEISDGDTRSGNCVDLFVVDSNKLSEFFTLMLDSPYTDPTATIDLRLLHAAMSCLSEREKSEESYIFGGNHADDLQHIYAAWVAQVLAKNCSLSATIQVDATARSIICTLIMQHRKTRQGYCFRFHSSFSARPEEWQKVLLQAIFGIPSPDA